MKACILAGLVALVPVAAAGQRASACADREAVIARLAEKYGETLRSLGLHRDNSIVEVYASEETGSWTILMTRPDGIACLVASGQMWEADARPLGPRGDDT